MASDKSQLRKTMTRRRRGLVRPLHGESVLAHWPESFADASVAGYYPFRSEFDCLPLLQTLRFAGVRTGLPLVTAADAALEFRIWRPGQPLVRGRYGISEPDASAERFVPDVILVPLLAFDADGGRLGYGGGYYDRTLAAFPNALAVGLAFDEQEVVVVPHEAHDRRLNAVLTPSGFRRVAASVAA